MILYFYRNCFSNGSNLNTSAVHNKKNLVKIIKFIGRQHLFLTEIIDKLNNCFSFQVNDFNIIHSHTPFYISFIIVDFHFSDDNRHYRNVCILCLGHLYFESVLLQTKWNVQSVHLCDSWMVSDILDRNGNNHLYCTLGEKWSK